MRYRKRSQGVAEIARELGATHVVEGSVRVESGGEKFEAPPGTLLTFEPDERRSVSTDKGARLLLFFAPWPGAGHYRGGEQPAETSA